VSPPPPAYRSEENLKRLIEFNYGQVTEVDTTKLKCVCGKHLDDRAAMCAACATVFLIDSVGYMLRTLPQ